jgi:hypothetical protein
LELDFGKEVGKKKQLAQIALLGGKRKLILAFRKHFSRRLQLPQLRLDGECENFCQERKF